MGVGTGNAVAVGVGVGSRVGEGVAVASIVGVGLKVGWGPGVGVTVGRMAGVGVGVAACLVSCGICCVGTGVPVTVAGVVGVGRRVGAGVIPDTGVPTGGTDGRGADVAVGMGVVWTVGTGVMVRGGTGTLSVKGGVGVTEAVCVGVGTVGRVARGASSGWGTGTGRPDTSGTSILKPAGVGVGSDPLQAAVNTIMRKTAVTKIFKDVQEPGKVSLGKFVLPQAPPRGLGPARPSGRPGTGGARD